jgi:hypothetical protein
MQVVRKNQLLFTATFEDPSGAGLQPDNATLKVWYPDAAGVRQLVTIPMTVNAEHQWSAMWSSTVASPGLIEWAAWSDGAVQGAAQGSFNLIANKANVS